MADGSVRSPASTIEVDLHSNMQQSSPIRADPRSSLHHVLDDTNPRPYSPPQRGLLESSDSEELLSPPPARETPSAPSGSATGGRKKRDPPPGTTPASSIYVGNKVRHLKKDDGEPLWRKDIQYDFLKLIFEDGTECFTNPYEPGSFRKQTFSELYIDAMARSSKTSKILRDKLLSDNEPAKNMAMVCLLVNLGRMNTTLNCTPPFLCKDSTAN